MKAVNDAGFHVLARPSNYENCTPDDVKAVFARLDGFDVSEIVFSGQQSLGAPKALQTTIDEMKNRQINLGLIEAVTQLQFYKQDGMQEIAKGLGYDHVARSIPFRRMSSRSSRSIRPSSAGPTRTRSATSASICCASTTSPRRT